MLLFVLNCGHVSKEKVKGKTEVVVEPHQLNRQPSVRAALELEHTWIATKKKVKNA